jgi:hypothetical protein
MAPATQPGERTAPFHNRTMITISESPDIVPFPAPAQTLEESGLSLDLVLQLTLKSLHFAGELAGTDLSRRLGLEFGVIASALDLLKAQHRCSWKAATTWALRRCRWHSTRIT